MPKIGEIKRSKELGYKNRYSKHIWRACVDCGEQRWVRLIGGTPDRIRCHHCGITRWGKAHARENSSAWKGGCIKAVKGYIQIRLYPDDFFYPMANKMHYVLEHRLVMATHLRRCLLPWEVVHHKNGIVNDNRTENLELLSSPKYHLPDMKLKTYLNKLVKEMEHLRSRVTLLEAENILLQKQLKFATEKEEKQEELPIEETQEEELPDI